MQAFEESIRNVGFKTYYEKDNNCDCLKEVEWYYWMQKCECCADKLKKPYKSVCLSWRRGGPFCEECLHDTMEIISCGGHYSNGRVFRKTGSIEEDMSETHWVDRPYPVDPDDLIEELS